MNFTIEVSISVRKLHNLWRRENILRDLLFWSYQKQILFGLALMHKLEHRVILETRIPEPSKRDFCGKFWIKPARIRFLHQIPAWDRNSVTHFSFGLLSPGLLFATSNKVPTSLLCPSAHLHLILSCCWTFSAVWAELPVKPWWMVDQAHFHRNTLDCFSKPSLSSLNMCVQKHIRGK